MHCELYSELDNLIAMESLSYSANKGRDDAYDVSASLTLFARIQEFHASCHLTMRSMRWGCKSRDDADLDSPAKAFRQSMKIRVHARMLMETHTARERLRSAGEAQLPWAMGVCVAKRFARDRTGGPSLSRWVGPGLVALQDGTAVWV